MALSHDIGHRIELVSMDPHCGNITIGLYRQQTRFLVHTYSSREGAPARIRFVIQAMAALGGMECRDGLLAYPCGEVHQAAARRLFLEACKLPGDHAPAVRPMSIVDKKSGHEIVLQPLGRGAYRVTGTDAARADNIVNGFRKLAEVAPGPAGSAEFRFPCETPHDALVGLLLPRALNVRQVMREEEAAVSKGMLVAPSAQK
jgi:hypothetical protein